MEFDCFTIIDEGDNVTIRYQVQDDPARVQDTTLW